MNGSLRVLIADDHPVFRDGLRALFESMKGMVRFLPAMRAPYVTTVT